MEQAPRIRAVRFVIVNAFTGLNLALGLLALFAAAGGLIPVAAWCLLACVALDACDGSLARHWRVTTDFGAQLDSLADMTSFCIGSGVLAYYWLYQPHVPFPLIAAASGLYVLSGAIRLARFNAAPPNSTYFTGMPTTFVAAIMALTYLLFPKLETGFGIALVVLLAVLMVSMFPYPKLSQLRRLPPLVWPALAVCALVSPAWTFWALALVYILTGPLVWVRGRL
jgi:CDP-diacylglycerol--serine O-phosphatidyltransferase